MQLVAYGAQDIYLTGNPQITFFKVVYRRHTNFSMEAIQQTINGTQNPGQGGGANGTVTISRNGDLVHKVYVRVTGAALVTSDGNDIVDEVELEIGGQKIDKHNAEYMKVMNELSTSESKAIGLKALTGGIGTWGDALATGVQVCMIPLQFWFCRNPGLALPLIALQYHEVKLKFTWGSFTGAATATCDVFCDYIYLDTDERRRFAQQSHEYLIEQVQRQTEGTAAGFYKLNFNHPVKELVWTTAAAGLTTQDTKLSLNGHDRFSNQRAEYFQLRQPLDHHTAVPRQNLPSSAQLTSNYVRIGADMIDAAFDLTSVADLGGVGLGNANCNALEEELAIVKITAAAAAAGDMTVDLLDEGGAYVAGRVLANTTGHAAYLVLNADVDGFASFPAGTFVRITGSGNRFVGGAAVGSTMFATITLSVLGGGGGAAAQVAATTRILQFDRPLFIGNANMTAGAVVITNIELLTPDAVNPSEARTSTLTEKINVYSFALKPEEHQPSGTCNFSRIDTAKLEFSGVAGAVTVANIYAVNYNVLRIMSGMGGLAYSN